MFKKMIVVAVVGGLAVAAIKGTRWASYIRTELNSLRESAEEEIPLDKQLAMLEDGVKRLDRTILSKINEVAKAQAEAGDLDKQVVDLQARQNEKKVKLSEWLTAIKTANGQFVKVGDKSFAKSAVEADLDRDFKQWELNNVTLEKLKIARDAHLQNATILKEQLDALVAQQKQVGAEVQALKAELQQLRLKQIKSKVQSDNSDLARLKEDLRKLRVKVDAQQHKQNLMTEVFGKAETPQAAPSLTLDAIEAKLNADAPAATATQPTPEPALPAKSIPKTD
jgi:chromosome segregation ATPase